MTNIVQSLAEDLARDVMEYVTITGDEDLIRDVIQTLGDRSQTLEEAFIIAVRVLQAEQAARKMLDKRIKRLPAPAPSLQDRADQARARRQPK